jgi:hypothetical protein
MTFKKTLKKVLKMKRTGTLPTPEELGFSKIVYNGITIWTKSCPIFDQQIRYSNNPFNDIPYATK